ncbi:hypothetical protein ACQEVM_36475 [Streptomyces sp. CA-243310]|uniref:hypothetical protein n=1 Tax=Streptomyces sp. CA-243310 TaxID=3240056 RepID=UPI003D90631A
MIFHRPDLRATAIRRGSRRPDPDVAAQSRGIRAHSFADPAGTAGREKGLIISQELFWSQALT